MKRLIALLSLALPLILKAQYQLTPLSTDQKTSIRGLSVVNDNVIWVSGSGGAVGKSTDAGKTWTWTKPKGYEKVDFRDIEAFDSQRAIIMGIASPAYILKTVDGGVTWKEVYKNADTAMFLDGMDFWDEKTGMIYGDPINGKMQLLKTIDGGESWQNVSENLKTPLTDGEASFAASGTNIRTSGRGKVWIATGGKVSNIYISNDYGLTWQRFACPILQGENSTGPFSIAFDGRKNGVTVGGNYVKDQENTNNVLLTVDNGKTWTKPKSPVLGYRSAVEYVTPKILIATGTSGTDISEDGGDTWQNIARSSFNSVKKAKKGSLVILAGNKGQVFKVTKK